jgi:hypothetical protein
MIPAVAQLPNLPPALAVGALYDSFLQAALRQFFARATFETDPMLSASSDGRLAIEPTDDPHMMYVRWFGTRYGLRVPERRPFTPHEIRMARAIGSVLAARYHAILNPKAMLERGELFRGAIEDRYAGVFADGHPYPIGSGVSRADRIAAAIEVLRVAALSSYENRAISTGVLILGPDGDGKGDAPAYVRALRALEYSQQLTAVKSFFKLVDGQHTLFLATHESRLLDIVDVREWSAGRCANETLPAPVPSIYEAHARATIRGNHVCVVLSPSHEIKVFAQGAEVLTFRHAHWHLLDVQAKFELWAEAVGQRSLATRLFQTALELSNARKGALFVVLRDPVSAMAQLVSVADRVDIALSDEARALARTPTRRDLLDLLTGRTITDLEPSVLAALASLDGATVTDTRGSLIAAGAILRSASGDPLQDDVIVEGARTTAALTASRFGPVLKVSEDGAMTFYDGAKVWDL